MTGPQQNTLDQQAATMYCPQCGQAMRIAPEHQQTTVACPHCDHAIVPWHTLNAAGGQAAKPTPPTAPPYGGPQVGPPRDPNVVYSWRNRWIAGVLGIVLGSLGVHRFYLGFPGIGILQIILTVITFGIAGIWGFIEGILCLVGAMRDAEGRPLSD